jgi:hypothetical protein
MQIAEFMSSLFVSGCNDCLEKTCEFRQETLFVCYVECWQQTMGGQGHCKHSMEKENKTMQDKYKKEFKGKEGQVCGFWLHLLWIV